MSAGDGHSLVLDGSSPGLSEVVCAARQIRSSVSVASDALERVGRGREQIEGIVDRYRAACAADDAAIPHVYGVTTGFGEFKSAPIPPDLLEELQENILLSHAAGVGDNADEHDGSNCFPPEVVRTALILRLNAFLHGHSGVRKELVSCLEGMFNAGIAPLVPIKGSVGSSGDLCPLAHTFLPLVGHGKFWDLHQAERLGPRGLARTTGWKICAGRELESALSRVGATPVRPSFKEGLALTNGTTYASALLALASHDAAQLACLADVAAAMTLEAIGGRTRALDARVQAVRPHIGQGRAAGAMRALLAGSSLVDRAAEVQDAYSVRCAPQVHGASRDAMAYALMVIETELGSVTDNPLFFPDEEAGPEVSPAYSAGNFHGQPIGIASDALAIAVAELANISERRIAMLLDKNHNRNLPAHLTAFGGVHSGLMIAQYTAASLVSENKVLAHPASVDSIPTSANSEDHNAMATIAARKARSVVANAQAVLAIELLAAAQAIEWRLADNGHADPNGARSSGARSHDRSGAEMVEAALRKLAAFESTTGAHGVGPGVTSLGAGTRAAFAAVRAVSRAIGRDRPLEPEIRAVRAIVEDGSLLEVVGSACPGGVARIAALRSG